MTDLSFRLSAIAHGLANAINSGEFAGCSHDVRLALRHHSINLLEISEEIALPVPTKREATTKAAVVRDLAIKRAPNVQRLSARFGGLAFLVHAVGDRT